MASQPCTPPICDPRTPDGLKQCTAKADWIVEGTIESVTETHSRFCDNVIGCTSLWSGGTVTLAVADMKTTKGAVHAGRPSDKPGRTDMIKTASHCFPTRLSTVLIGQRIRFFGTEKSAGPNTGPGYFAFELVSR